MTVFSCYPSSHGKFFDDELSVRGRLRRVLYRKPSTRLGFRLFDLAMTFTLCLVYVIRVELDDYMSYQCGGSHCSVSTIQLPKATDTMVYSSNAINWYLLLWVRRPFILWILQVALSSVWFIRGTLVLYISPQGTRVRRFWCEGLVLDWLCTLPYLLTLVPVLRDMFLPGFLACWLVRRVIRNLLNDLQLTRQRCQVLSVTFTHQLVLLLVTLSCLIFTTMCGAQHIQRGSSGAELTMFESFYFVIVTFSTVGYGDISPDTWLGQLFMTCMIGLAFAFIPKQVEGVTSVLKEIRTTGGEYSERNARGHHHVVLCTTGISAEHLLNFLIEFYAHPHLEYHTVVLLSTERRDMDLRILLKDPKWSYRVIYIQGSALIEVDLQRCRLAEADACFILPPSVCDNGQQTDQLTLMQYLAAKDFAPNCRLYVKLHKLENKIHVHNEDHVVCGDEVKFAILANNCLNPGLSTLVTLLVNCSTIEAVSDDMEPWQQLYGMQSTNSIYGIKLNRSKIFRRYRGWSFTLASADAHKRYGVGLLAVQDRTTHDSRIQLNPGDGYKLRDFDYLLYISDVAEDMMSTSRLVSGRENAYIANDHIRDIYNNPQLPMVDISHRGGEPSIVSCPWGETPQGCDLQNTSGDEKPEESIILGPPPSSLCASSPMTQCYVMKVRRPDCCLEWGKDCDHCAYKNARHDLYGRQLIILAVEEESAGIMNFCVPLRSHIIEKDELRTIVLLLQKRPSAVFMETIGRFPLVFWIEGSITSTDDLIKSGIHKAKHLVVANMQSSSVTDSDTLFAVRTIQRLFPNTNVITEMNHAANVRFLHGDVPEAINLPVAKLEKTLKENMSSTLPHLFRLHFAAGKVFSTSMLDNLLYQTFVKQYLIMFVRRLIGIETENNTGYLSSIRVDGMTSSTYTTYGELYYGLASTSGKVPMAIYRTRNSMMKTDQNGSSKLPGQKSSHQFRATCDMQYHVCSRLNSLGMDTDAYTSGVNREPNDNISCIVLNPTSDTKLIDGDIVYVLQPASFLSHPPPAMNTEVKRAQIGQAVHV